MRNKLTADQEILYQSFVDDRELLDMYPYIRLPDKEAFFERFNPRKPPSFMKRLYHTFF